MSFLGDLFNPVSAVQDTWSGLASLPGTPEALGSGIYGGLSGDLSWNPYSQDNSVWDTGAGGTELSQDPQNRQYGRAIGTAVGAAFTGGALSAAGGAAEGAGDAALAADGTTVAGGAAEGTAGATGGSTLGSSIGAGAARGAGANASITAAQGGSPSQVFSSAGKGAVAGGIGGGISYANPSSYVGITNPTYSKAFNSAVGGGTNAAIGGGNVAQGFLGSGLNSGVNSFGNSVGDYFKGNTVQPNDNFSPASASGVMNNYTGTSPPQYSPEILNALGQTQQPPMSQPLSVNSSQGVDFSPSFGDVGTSSPTSSSGASTPFSGFLGSLLGNGGLGQIVNGGLATYSALDARRRYNNATSDINNMYAPNSPYAQQMAQSMARKDAAAGRNSQYGMRAVQLAAALTNSRAQALTSPGYGNLLAQQQKAYQQLPITGAAMLQSNWGKGMVNNGSQQLSNWFAGNNNPNYGNEGLHNPVPTTPAWDDGLIPGQ